jgi:hypothetical protein
MASMSSVIARPPTPYRRTPRRIRPTRPDPPGRAMGALPLPEPAGLLVLAGLVVLL